MLLAVHVVMLPLRNKHGSFFLCRYTFPSDAAVGGSFLYVSASETDFESWFGFSPTYEVL